MIQNIVARNRRADRDPRGRLERYQFYRRKEKGGG